MNYLTTLLTLATLLSTQAATSSLVGGVRVSTDTTGTNTIAANVVITNLNGGASRTALMSRDVQVTNAVKVLSLTGNRVVGIGTDKALTNTTVSIAALEALSTAGTNNWINSGTTNSTLAGTAYPWGVEVTNHVNVGASGEAGIILFTSTNGTYTASISLLANGTLVVTNNSVLVATVALVSGYDGDTNKFLSAAGTYLTGNLWSLSSNFLYPTDTNTIAAKVFGPVDTAGFYAQSSVDPSASAIVPRQIYILGTDGAARVNLFPNGGTTSTAFILETEQTHTSGDLFRVTNNGNDALNVTFDGRIKITGLTNQVVFGATNAAPSSAVAPTKWISVQVQGEAATYRLPLYE